MSRYSLVERVGGDGDEAFVTVSLSAAEFGKRKLGVSPWRRAIEKDLRLLREFGDGRKRGRDDAAYGVYPRIEHLVKSVAREASEDGDALERTMPILEYLAAKVPRGVRPTCGTGDGGGRERPGGCLREGVSWRDSLSIVILESDTEDGFVSLGYARIPGTCMVKFVPSARRE